MTTSYLIGQKLIDSIQNSAYSRDLIGYKGTPPRVIWPNQAKIAVQFVLNYEEGGENHVEHGDQGSEQFLSELVGAMSFNAKHMSMDSILSGRRSIRSLLIHQFSKNVLEIGVR